MSAPLPSSLDREEALALVRRRLSHADVRALEATPEGAALLRMFADLAADESARLDRSATARHLLPRESDVSPVATGPAQARADLELRRSRTGFSLAVPAGTVVSTPTGHFFALGAAAVFAAGDAGPRVVAATARVAGFGGNALAGSIDRFVRATSGAVGDEASIAIAASGASRLRTSGGDLFATPMAGLYLEFTAGANVGRVARIVAVIGPTEIELAGALVAEAGTASWALREWGDLGVTVAQPTDARGGSDDSLDELADEVERRRQEGESDDALRAALLTMTDTVSIGAIVRACNRALDAYGPIRAYETGTLVGEADAKLGLEAFPGLVCGLSPCGLAPDAATPPIAAPMASTPVGLTAVSPLYRFFVLRWDGAGLDDPGAYVRGSSGVVESDPVPMAAAAGVSPAGGAAFGDAALRAGIAATVQQIKAGGVGWRWYPRGFWA
jgi:hypothetical protein